MSSLRLALKMSMGEVSHQGDESSGKKSGNKDGNAKTDSSSNIVNGQPALKRKRSESEVSLSSAGGNSSLKGDKDSDVEEGSSNSSNLPVKTNPTKRTKDHNNNSNPNPNPNTNKNRTSSNLSDNMSRSNSVVDEKQQDGGLISELVADSDSTLTGTPSGKIVPKSKSSDPFVENSSVANWPKKFNNQVPRSKDKQIANKAVLTDSNKIGSSSNKGPTDHEESVVPRPVKSIKTINKMEKIVEKVEEKEKEKDDSNSSNNKRIVENIGISDNNDNNDNNNNNNNLITSEVAITSTEDSMSMDVVDPSTEAVDGAAEGDDEVDNAEDYLDKSKKKRNSSGGHGSNNHNSTLPIEGSGNNSNNPMLNSTDIDSMLPEGGSPRYQSHRAAAQIAKDRLAAKPTRTITATDGGPGDPSSTSYRAPEQRKNNGNKSGPIEEAKWVQCEQCTKWRLLPQHVDLDLLPEQWYCVMNEWDIVRNNCEAPEATADTTDATKDVKDGEATQEIPTTTTSTKSSHSRSSGSSKSNQHKRNNDDNDTTQTGGKSSSHRSSSGTGKAVDPVNWVQCNKCSKWRKVPGAIDVGGLPDKWFCSLNTWAPYYARCSAKEETDDPVDSKGDDDKAGGSSKSSSHNAKKSSGGQLSHSTSHGSNNALGGGGGSGTAAAAAAVKKVTQWVQCERRNCKKWRKVPAMMDMSKFPEKWYCELNSWDSERAGCDNAEESDSESEQQTGASPSRSQLILANSKGPGALSYRRIIFGTDGRIRPCYNEKNKSGYGLFSHTESSRNSNDDRNNDYIEPSRRVAYWWSSAYDEKSGTRFKSQSTSHPSANTPRGKESKDDAAAPVSDAPVSDASMSDAPVSDAPVSHAQVADVQDTAEAPAEAPVPIVVSPRPRDRDRGMSKELALLLGDEREREDKHSTPKKPRERTTKDKEDDDQIVPFVEVAIAALEVEQSSCLIDTIRRINHLSIASKLQNGVPKMRQKLWNFYSNMSIVERLKTECNVIRCCLLSSPTCSLSLPTLINALHTMSFTRYAEEVCRRCMSMDAVTAAVRLLEVQGEIDVFLGTCSEIVIVGFPPVSTKIDPMIEVMEEKWAGKGVPLKMRKALGAISASRAQIEEEEKAKKKRKSSSSSSSSSLSHRSSRFNNNSNSDNEEGEEGGAVGSRVGDDTSTKEISSSDDVDVSVVDSIVDPMVKIEEGKEDRKGDIVLKAEVDDAGMEADPDPSPGPSGDVEMDVSS